MTATRVIKTTESSLEISCKAALDKVIEFKQYSHSLKLLFNALIRPEGNLVSVTGSIMLRVNRTSNQGFIDACNELIKIVFANRTPLNVDLIKDEIENLSKLSTGDSKDSKEGSEKKEISIKETYLIELQKIPSKLLLPKYSSIYKDLSSLKVFLEKPDNHFAIMGEEIRNISQQLAPFFQLSIKALVKINEEIVLSELDEEIDCLIETKISLTRVILELSKLTYLLGLTRGETMKDAALQGKNFHMKIMKSFLELIHDFRPSEYAIYKDLEISLLVSSGQQFVVVAKPTPRAMFNSGVTAYSEKKYSQAYEILNGLIPTVKEYQPGKPILSLEVFDLIWNANNILLEILFIWDNGDINIEDYRLKHAESLEILKNTRQKMLVDYFKSSKEGMFYLEKILTQLLSQYHFFQKYEDIFSLKESQKSLEIFGRFLGSLYVLEREEALNFSDIFIESLKKFFPKHNVTPLFDLVCEEYQVLQLRIEKLEGRKQLLDPQEAKELKQDEEKIEAFIQKCEAEDKVAVEARAKEKLKQKKQASNKKSKGAEKKQAPSVEVKAEEKSLLDFSTPYGILYKQGDEERKKRNYELAQKKYNEAIILAKAASDHVMIPASIIELAECMMAEAVEILGQLKSSVYNVTAEYKKGVPRVYSLYQQAAGCAETALDYSQHYLSGDAINNPKKLAEISHLTNSIQLVLSKANNKIGEINTLMEKEKGQANVRLQAMRVERDEIMHRWGIHLWRNNPNPKRNYQSFREKLRNKRDVAEEIKLELTKCSSQLLLPALEKLKALHPPEEIKQLEDKTVVGDKSQSELPASLARFQSRFKLFVGQQDSDKSDSKRNTVSVLGENKQEGGVKGAGVVVPGLGLVTLLKHQ